MICCLNPYCHNPPCADGTNFCINCGTPLVVLRRYRPIRRVGGGGFGTTYLAEDIEKFDEPCVIKQFAPQVQGTAALQVATRLFEQEARRLHHLGQHPQIPALLAYFEQDKRLYLVQEYIEGQNLFDELQQQGTFSERKIQELLRDLLEILKLVHQQQVIHRDIKPENIIRRSPPAPLNKGGEFLNKGGELVLIDFGASKQATATAMAKPGTVIGSFGYVPMEQMQGGEAYPSSDLYSLGATCFHLLSGIHPWELWKTQAYGWVQNWRQHLQQPASQELGAILDKLLQENHQQRYQSVEEVLRELNSQPPPPPLVSPTVVSPPQPSPPPPPVSPTVAPHRQPPPSPPIASAKQNAKFKNPLLVGGTIAYKNLALDKTLSGHFIAVTSVAFSPDGQTIASGSGDYPIKIWNVATGQEIRTLSGHSNLVTSVAFSPDGETIASGSWDKTIKIWNVATGQEIRTLSGDSNGVSSVAFSPDGKTIASGSGDYTIKIWNVTTGQEIRTLSGHSSLVNSVAFSPDGQTIASGSEDDTIKIWNVATGQEIRTLSGHSSSVNSVAFSPDGQTIASGSWDDTIKICHVATGQEIRTLSGHSNWVNSVAFSPDGQTIASGSWDKTIKIWNVATGQEIRTLSGHSREVNSVAFSPDGKTIASGSEDETIKIWRVPK